MCKFGIGSTGGFELFTGSRQFGLGFVVNLDWTSVTLPLKMLIRLFHF